jgi:hypothetical protein
MSLVDFIASTNFHYLIIGLTLIYFIYKKSLQSKKKTNSYTNIILIPLFAYLTRYIVMKNQRIITDVSESISESISDINNKSKHTSSLLSSPYPITSMSDNV